MRGAIRGARFLFQKAASERKYFPEAGFRFFEAPADSLGGDAVPLQIELTLTKQDEFIHKQRECNAITIRTAEGELGILAGHEYTIEQLSPGVIDIDIDADVKERYAISGGFAHVNDNGVVDINCVECIPLNELDLDKVSKYIEEAKADLNHADAIVRAKAEIAMELYEPLDFALRQTS
eukprot:TRINITY_DN5815_c0_g1_i1.p1 TRINITY_DN5815_c0_g1~~TRINITY_DN5815_c0_g1_i1.p1  ORF type:complete len:179 (+),score=41.12 TRINITY_DN5815_c0_g1_i1:63-599(+)